MAAGRRLRTFVFATFVLAFWALARPARAADAPFCDDRGATALADPPALEAPDESIARARACTTSGDELSYFASIVGAKGGSATAFHAASSALPVASGNVVHAESETASVTSPARVPAPGVRSRVDRPPRALGR